MNTYSFMEELITYYIKYGQGKHPAFMFDGRELLNTDFTLCRVLLGLVRRVCTSYIIRGGRQTGFITINTNKMIILTVPCDRA